MDLLESLIRQLSKKNFLNLSFIYELNECVGSHLQILYCQYKETHNKYYLTQELVKYGFKLESLIKNKSGEILDSQIFFLYGLINPIVFKIKEICFCFLNNLIDDIKNTFDKYLNLLSNKCVSNKSNDITISHSRCLKFIQLSSSITVPIFGKQYQMTKLAETNFNEFGITVKVTNLNYKNQLKPLIELLGLFTFPDKNDVFFKKFDWVWKINQSNLLTADFSIDKNLTLFNEKINELQENFSEKPENILNMVEKINWATNNNVSNEFVIGNNNDKSNEIIESEQNEKTENFQIIQSNELTDNENNKNLCIELIDNSVIEELTLYNNKSYKKKNNKNITVYKENDNSKTLSNFKIVEDKSFILPIDNFNDNFNDNTTNNLQDNLTENLTEN